MPVLYVYKDVIPYPVKEYIAQKLQVGIWLRNYTEKA